MSVIEGLVLLGMILLMIPLLVMHPVGVFLGGLFTFLVYVMMLCRDERR